jgi:hypothetical protein
MPTATPLYPLFAARIGGAGGQRIGLTDIGPDGRIAPARAQERRHMTSVI